MKRLHFFLLALLLPAIETVPLEPVPSSCQARDEDVAPDVMRQLVEEDWLQSLQVSAVTTQSDAAGACDGVKNGTYGFHVGLEADPWWQVNLGEIKAVGRVTVYNHLDYAPGLHNANTLQILSSIDGEDWTLCHDNQGRHFGGEQAPAPLEVSFAGQGLLARFIRLQIPSSAPIFFHLDEVEIYGVGDDTKNIALGQPADQSSLSPWSTSKIELPKPYPITAVIERGLRSASFLREQDIDVSHSVADLDRMSNQLGRTER